MPGPSNFLLRLPVARRTRLAAGHAGSRGSASVAATAKVDFEIRRNGTNFAAMRFAAAADTASVIAAAETVLEPGDLLRVVAPATPDAMLADVALNLVGTLVL